MRKYGGPNVTVQISEIWGADGLHVTVADNGRGASSSLDGHKPGYGLIGMREQIGAIGGSVTVARSLAAASWCPASCRTALSQRSPRLLRRRPKART